MALSKGKKVLIAIVGAVVTIGTVIGTVFAVKKIKENVEMTDRPGITTPVDPTPGTPVDPTPDDPVDPTPDDPVDPDPDTPVDPDPGEEEPETPEMSEEEYYKENLGLLKTAIVEEYRKDFEDFANVNLEIDESQEIVINEAAGEIYFFGDRTDIFGGSSDLFFVAKFDKNILSETQENLNLILKSKTRNFDINFESNKTIRGNLSETVYNEFSKYVCNESYESNGEIINFSEDAQVLDISTYIYDYNAYGSTYIKYLIIDNGKVYTARLENAMPPELSDWGIGQIMGYSNNVFKITEIKDFKEFDYEEEAAQAQSEFFLDLSEVAISKDQAQDLANAIRTSNPKKLGNMEVKLPAQNPDFEL